MVRRAGKEMEPRVKVTIELDRWYDEECQVKKRDTKIAHKEYKYRDDEEYRGRYWECRKQY